MAFECRPRDCTFPTCMCPVYNRHKSHLMYRHCAVATATIILSGDLGIVVRFPERVRHLFQNVWGPPSVIFNGYRRMSPGVKWPACETTTHIHVVSNLRINGSITPLPPCAWRRWVSLTLNCLTLEDGNIRLPRNVNYQLTLYEIPEQRRPQSWYKTRDVEGRGSDVIECGQLYWKGSGKTFWLLNKKCLTTSFCY